MIILLFVFIQLLTQPAHLLNHSTVDSINRSSRSLPLQPGYVTASPQSHSVNSSYETDHITNIQSDPTQIVVFTTKNGPHDKLRIRIELTDLKENRIITPIDLQGIWLMISRGKYTIPFLKPDHWYGLYFRSENIINNRPISHVEERLIKTASRQANSSTPTNPLFDVKMHRSLDGEVNTEGFYVTARWLHAVNRVNGSDVVVDVSVDCLHSKSSEKIRLPYYEDSVTVEIRVDHRYELENLNKTSHQVKAHITPTVCKRICWKKSIEMVSAKNRFAQEFGTECKDIEGTTSVTYLRNLKHYTVEGNSDRELVIVTESVENTEEAFITIQALRIDQSNASDVVYRTFNTKNTNGEFRIPLDNDAVYAVQYEYTKIKPFHYTEKEHFVVETPAVNSSRPSHVPIEIEFHPQAVDEHTKLEEVKPEIVLKRGLSYDVHLHLESFCENVEKDVLLTNEQPSYHIDAHSVLCSSPSKYPFCSSNITNACSSTILCYSNAIMMKNDLDTSQTVPERYSSDIRCLNVTQHFNLPSFSSKIPISLNIFTFMYGFTFYYL
ncbi:unnamed protein product [Auanema sp. JU1783]|nr:unnamed protein product [Auanema sp. JU1783]